MNRNMKLKHKELYKLHCPEGNRTRLHINRIDDGIGLLQNKAICLAEGRKQLREIRAHCCIYLALNTTKIDMIRIHELKVQ